MSVRYCYWCVLCSKYNALMRGEEPPVMRVPRAPALLPSSRHAIKWRGSTGAQTYELQRRHTSATADKAKSGEKW